MRHRCRGPDSRHRGEKERPGHEPGSARRPGAFDERGRAGDVHSVWPELRRFAAPFGAEEHACWTWTLEQAPADLHGLMASRSFWLRASESTRAKMAANLDWYLHEHMRHGPDEAIVLPYVSVAWRASSPRRRRRGE